MAIENDAAAAEGTICGASGVAILEDFGLLCIVLVRVTVGSIFVDNLPQVSSFGERISAVSMPPPSDANLSTVPLAWRE